MRAVPASRGAPRRLLAAWAGVWALLLQIMVPLGQGLPLPAGADGLPRTLVICSATQPRTIPGPGADSRSSTPAERAACAVCLAYACGQATDLPTAVLLPRPAVFAAAATRPPAQPVIAKPAIALPRPRGPPVLV